MSWLRRKRLNLVHQDQRRDGEDTDTEVKPEIPGMQAFSSLLQPARKASQSPPPCSGEGAPSEPGSPRNKGSLSCLRVVSSAAQSTTAELATTSKITPRGEASLASRSHPALYQDCRRPNSAETLVTNRSEEVESSSASTGLSHHLESFSSQLKTAVSPVGRAVVEQSRPLIIDRLDRGSRTSNTDRSSSPRRNLRHRKSTMVALEKEGWTKEPAHIQGCQAAQSLKDSSEEISCRPRLRLYEEIFGNEEDRDCCRICHGSDNSPTDPLRLCLCSGSLKFIHLACLKDWTGSGPYSVKTCELCKGRLTPDLETAHNKFGRVVRGLRRWMNLTPGTS